MLYHLILRSRNVFRAQLLSPMRPCFLDKPVYNIFLHTALQNPAAHKPRINKKFLIRFLLHDDHGYKPVIPEFIPQGIIKCHITIIRSNPLYLLLRISHGTEIELIRPLRKLRYPRIMQLKKDIEDLNKKNEVLKADYEDLESQIRELEHEKAMLPRAGANCPYTNEACETAAKLVQETEAKIAEIDKQIEFKKDEMKDCDPSLVSANDREILKLSAELGGIQTQYDRLASIELQLKNIPEVECPTDLNLIQIDEKIRFLQDKLVQIEANKKYDELSEKVTADKFKLENNLEIYKIWVKKTDANGLQTALMNQPFEELAAEMSRYLTQMFGQQVIAKFNLIAKANTFSFGLERNGSYIEFDYLSSGERCLFTLALILCLLNKSNSKVRTILIDDILDHLDNENASYLFDALNKIEGIQFILAGVKQCEDQSICKEV